MHFIIYKLTNKINNKIYIGKHKTIDINDEYMGSGTVIQTAINKYGKDNFKKEILYDFNTEEEANKKEREIVNEEFIRRDDTYNLVLGGKGGGREPGSKNTEQAIKNMKIAQKIRHQTYKISEETKLKMSISHKKRYMMNPFLKKICSEARKGRKHKPETIEKMKKWHREVGMSEEVLQKRRLPRSETWAKNISKALSGKPKTDEHKKKLSEIAKHRYDNKIRIYNKQTGKFHLHDKNLPIPDGYYVKTNLS